MAKRENDMNTIKDLMQLFIKENNLTKGMQKVKIEEYWNSIMGQGVQSYTTSVRLQHKTLFVELSSSALREELSYGKDKIIKMINEEFNSEIITKLVLI